MSPDGKTSLADVFANVRVVGLLLRRCALDLKQRDEAEEIGYLADRVQDEAREGLARVQAAAGTSALLAAACLAELLDPVSTLLG